MARLHHPRVETRTRQQVELITTALAGLLPFLPTTRREFEQGDEAFAFVRIYQRGRKAPGAVSVSARVADESGRTVDEVTDGR